MGLLAVFSMVILCKTVSSTEYCIDEMFQASCNGDEIIIMQKALFGQISIGRCITEESGFLGCMTDQLNYMDQQCSGKKSCDVIVAHIKADVNCTLPSYQTRYLEAQYSCKRVSAQGDVCSKSKIISAKAGIQFLSSTAFNTIGCADESHPLILEAKPGQTINISMVDFNWNPLQKDLQGCVQRYGYIIDAEHVTNICGKTNRMKQMMISQGHSLQMVIDKNVLTQAQFLIQYQVNGCHTYEAPKGTWTKYEDGIIIVGCISNDLQWRMRCLGNHWVGIQRSCETDNEEKEHTKTLVQHHENSLPQVVTYTLIGGSFAVIFCVIVTLFIGFFCIRKPAKTSSSNYPTIPYHIATMPMRQNVQTWSPNNTVPLLLIGEGHGTHESSQLSNGQENATPVYYVLEGPDNQKNNGPIYEAVYQNTADARQASVVL